MRQALWLERDYVKLASEQMRIRGMKVADSLWAAAAGNLMLGLDRACMPAGVPDVPVEYTLRRHNLIIARCHHVVPKRRERYEVFVVNFLARMEDICRQHELMHGDKSLDILRAVMAVSAHEVRHRLQRRMPGLTQFRPFHRPGSDMLLQGVAAVQSECFRESNKLLRTNAKGQILANMFHNDEEFDASVVERMMMHRGPNCKTMDELAHLVLLEPTL